MLLPSLTIAKAYIGSMLALQELDYLQKQVDRKQMSGELPFVTQYEALPEIGQDGDRHRPWRPSAHRDLAEPELGAMLRKVTLFTMLNILGAQQSAASSVELRLLLL